MSVIDEPCSTPKKSPNKHNFNTPIISPIPIKNKTISELEYFIQFSLSPFNERKRIDDIFNTTDNKPGKQEQ